MNDFLNKLLQQAPPTGDAMTNFLQAYEKHKQQESQFAAPEQQAPNEFANPITPDGVNTLRPQSTGTMIDSMVSPPGIQAPLYNYNQSPQDNTKLGSSMADISNIPVMTSNLSMDNVAPKAPTPNPVMARAMPETNKSAEALMPKQTTPEAKETTPNPMDEFKALQDEKRKDTSMLNIIDAANRIGTAIAGAGHLEYKPGQFDGLKEQAGAEVADFIQRNKVSKEFIDLQMAKQQADNAKALSDPNSAISNVARNSYAESLKKIGRHKDADQIMKANLSSQQLHDLLGTQNLANMYSAYEAQQNRLEMAKTRSHEKAQQNQEKLDKEDIKRLDAANKMIQSSLARNNTAFGRMAGIQRAAAAIEKLAEGNNNLDNRQIKELAASLDTMLTAGSSTVSGRAGLVPHTYSGDAANIAEYITNIPHGAQQQAFVRRALETVEREKQLAKEQVKHESKKMLSSYADLQKKNPEAWNTMMINNELDPDMFKDIGSKESKPSIDADLTKMNNSELEAYIKAHGG